MDLFTPHGWRPDLSKRTQVSKEGVVEDGPLFRCVESVESC